MSFISYSIGPGPIYLLLIPWIGIAKAGVFTRCACVQKTCEKRLVKRGAEKIS